MEIVTPSTKPNKSSSVFSWLGFGMATALLILIWFVNILAFNLAGKSSGVVGGLYILVTMSGSIVGLLAMAFSITGLIMAVRGNGPKWIGVTGIVICILSLFSFFVPIMCAGFIKEKAHKVERESSVSAQHSETDEVITIQIFSVGRVRCINNTNPKGGVIGNMDTLDDDFNKQMAKWLEMNNVDSSTSITVNSSAEADYSDVTKVVDALQENGITNYRMISTLSDSDYYN